MSKFITQHFKIKIKYPAKGCSPLNIQKFTTESLKGVFWAHFLEHFEVCFGAIYAHLYDVFVKHGCPRRNQCQNMAKSPKSYILTPLHHRGMWCQWSVEQSSYELTVQFCNRTTTQTLYVSRTVLRTNERTIRFLDVPADLSGRA